MTVCDTSPAGTLGLSTCYDLRFPEMYACLAGKGSQVRRSISCFYSSISCAFATVVEGAGPLGYCRSLGRYLVRDIP